MTAAMPLAAIITKESQWDAREPSRSTSQFTARQAGFASWPRARTSAAPRRVVQQEDTTLGSLWSLGCSKEGSACCAIKLAGPMPCHYNLDAGRSNAPFLAQQPSTARVRCISRGKQLSPARSRSLTRSLLPAPAPARAGCLLSSAATPTGPATSAALQFNLHKLPSRNTSAPHQPMQAELQCNSKDSAAAATTTSTTIVSTITRPRSSSKYARRNQDLSPR